MTVFQDSALIEGGDRPDLVPVCSVTKQDLNSAGQHSYSLLWGCGGNIYDYGSTGARWNTLFAENV